MKFAASLGCSQDWEDLWHDCLIELVGDHGPGKLTSFQGHAGLQSWLGTVLRRFIWKRQREGRKTLSQPVEETGPPEEEVISQECLRLFRIWIDQALSDLSPRDRLLLFLRHVKALKGKEIAGIIGIHPGRISEGLKGARIHFRDLLERGTSSEARKQQEQQECLRHLLGGAHRFSFGQLLIEALRQFDPEGEES
jgi:RNA polymerase sigma factor (sigma-70 family)